MCLYSDFSCQLNGHKLPETFRDAAPIDVSFVYITNGGYINIDYTNYTDSFSLKQS